MAKSARAHEQGHSKGSGPSTESTGGDRIPDRSLLLEARQAMLEPERASVRGVQALQRRVGNRETRQLLEESLAVSRQAAPRPLPHLERIQEAFGPHDLKHVQARVGGGAARAAEALGARAFAAGEQVAFAGEPDLRTVAHEAAHVVQQRQGLSLPGGMGTYGDVYERRAELVAERVVAGQSAKGLLGPVSEAGGGAPGGQAVVQCLPTLEALYVKDVPEGPGSAKLAPVTGWIREIDELLERYERVGGRAYPSKDPPTVLDYLRRTRADSLPLLKSAQAAVDLWLGENPGSQKREKVGNFKARLRVLINAVSGWHAPEAQTSFSETHYDVSLETSDRELNGYLEQFRNTAGSLRAKAPDAKTVFPRLSLLEAMNDRLRALGHEGGGGGALEAGLPGPLVEGDGGVKDKRLVSCRTWLDRELETTRKELTEVLEASEGEKGRKPPAGSPTDEGKMGIAKRGLGVALAGKTVYDKAEATKTALQSGLAAADDKTLANMNSGVWASISSAKTFFAALSPVLRFVTGISSFASAILSARTAWKDRDALETAGKAASLRELGAYGAAKVGRRFYKAVREVLNSLSRLVAIVLAPFTSGISFLLNLVATALSLAEKGWEGLKALYKGVKGTKGVNRALRAAEIYTLVVSGDPDAAALVIRLGLFGLMDRVKQKAGTAITVLTVAGALVSEGGSDADGGQRSESDSASGESAEGGAQEGALAGSASRVPDFYPASDILDREGVSAASKAAARDYLIDIFRHPSQYGTSDQALLQKLAEKLKST